MTYEEAIKVLTDTRVMILKGSGTDLANACSMAIEALKKQIPKEVITKDEKGDGDFYWLAFICPTCDEAVIGQPYKPNHCKHCGQALDWSE